ncbi:MAG: four helix bundle protein [Pyrinomonadaceae bacterium]|nr:four helix bundle protein [Pyrinomonadaceae bacterium]
MAKFNSFEEIVAWQKAHQLTLQIYRITSDGDFGKDFGLKDQVRRASVSIMANIAEGHGRRTNSEFANFLNLARGSAAEVQSHLHVAVGLDYISQAQFTELYDLTSEVSRMVLSLAQYLRSSRP